jgi:tyrosyl-tRNA synthetase
MKGAVEWFADRISHGGLVSKKQFNELLEQAKEMEKEREKSIFSIAYRITPIEFGKEYCESEFEKFNKTFKQQEQ